MERNGINFVELVCESERKRVFQNLNGTNFVGLERQSNARTEYWLSLGIGMWNRPEPILLNWNGH